MLESVRAADCLLSQRKCSGVECRITFAMTERRRAQRDGYPTAATLLVRLTQLLGLHILRLTRVPQNHEVDDLIVLARTVYQPFTIRPRLFPRWQRFFRERLGS